MLLFFGHTPTLPPDRNQQCFVLQWILSLTKSSPWVLLLLLYENVVGLIRGEFKCILQLMFADSLSCELLFIITFSCEIFIRCWKSLDHHPYLPDDIIRCETIQLWLILVNNSPGQDCEKQSQSAQCAHKWSSLCLA